MRHRSRRPRPVADPALSDFLHAGGHPHHPVPDALPPSGSTSLDLSAPVAPRPAPPVVARRLPPARRARPGQQTILTADERTVSLNRLQSAVGTLTIEAACSAEVGDLVLACAYQLATGASSVVSLDGGSRFAPPGAPRPLLVASHDRFETVAVDLRQLPLLERLALVASSRSRQTLRWGGTLVVTTFGGARVEVPIEVPPGPGVAVLLTAYNVAGELVLRRELERVDGSVRDAARAYGYDRITWLDDRTPVD